MQVRILLQTIDVHVAQRKSARLLTEWSRVRVSPWMLKNFVATRLLRNRCLNTGMARVIPKLSATSCAIPITDSTYSYFPQANVDARIFRQVS